MDFDKVLQHVGEFGKYQKFVYFMLCFPLMLVSMNMLTYVFNAAIPPHRCYIHGCDNSSSAFCEPWLNYTIPSLSNSSPNDSCTERYEPCKKYAPVSKSADVCDLHSNFSYVESCSSLKYDYSVYGFNVVTEWELSCDNDWLVPLFGALVMLGAIVGSAVFGVLSDRFGRRRMLMIALAMMSLTSFAVTFCPTYAIFLVVRFVQASAGAGVFLTIFVLVTEMVGQNWRTFCGIGINVMFAVGEVLLGIIAYFLRDWKQLQLAVTIPTLLFLPFYWIVPESVRWLIARKQYREAQSAIQKIAIVNKSTVPFELLEFDLEIVAASERSGSTTEVKKRTALDLFRRPRMRRRTLNILMNWFMNTIGYYGISMNVSNLGGNVYVDFILVSLIELPSYIFCLLVLDRWGRRRPLIICMVFGGFACFSTMFVPPRPAFENLTVGLAIVGKFGTAASLAIMYVYSAELFPTVLRTNGLGLSSFIGHLGGVFVPYISTLNSVYKGLPLIIYGSSLMLSGFMAIFLPETHGKRLPETVEDAENFGSKYHDQNVNNLEEEGETLLWNQVLVQRCTTST